MLKSRYSDYPKSGYIRTICPTENRCPKFGYSNSEKNTIFRAFFHDFYVFAWYTTSMSSFFDFCTLFTVQKSCQKWRKNIVEENSENDEEHNDENDEENDENYDYITDRSFEAFVTVIEISIFGFENSTLVARDAKIQRPSKWAPIWLAI